ncbi:MAG: hypothetical protein QM426_04680 [Euryarchaeota archaeon]|nr:hypothetical protein [Euryarchaeota archaeon]
MLVKMYECHDNAKPRQHSKVWKYIDVSALEIFCRACHQFPMIVPA